MSHLSEEELIEVYYNEAERPAAAHLQACRECAKRYKQLTQGLDAIRPAAASQQRTELGERVWQALRPNLTPYERKARGWQGWAHWRFATLAVSSALLLAATFVGGRYWERHAARKSNAVAVATSQPAQHTVLVVLTDHLDRTERLLVALDHADSSDPAENVELQSEARELLASNRLYRATASDAGDPVLANALDRLERVLAEIANEPHLTSADLQQVRKEMNTEGILFEIRVLKERKPNQESGPTHMRGATI
jgi:hypothetical protein